MKNSKIKEIDPHFSESSYLVNREKFKDFDPIKMMENSGCHYDSKTGIFEMPVLGEIYYAKYPEGNVKNAEGKDFDNYSVKIIILRYLMNAKASQGTTEMISYKEFPDGPLYYPNFYKRCIQVFGNIGNEMPKEMQLYMEKIKGEALGKGDMSWSFTFMPGVEMGCILWLGDDEFEPEGQILFDKRLIGVFNIKDLAILGDVFILSMKSFTFSL
ncbi:MAG: DUF3786 domain-containing protein [Eubacteriaceae bacterium]